MAPQEGVEWEEYRSVPCAVKEEMMEVHVVVVVVIVIASSEMSGNAAYIPVSHNEC